MDESQNIAQIIDQAVSDTFDFNSPDPGGCLRVRFANLEKVIHDLKGAIELYPDSLDLHGHYTLALCRQGRKLDARKHWDALSTQHRNDPDFSINRAFAAVVYAGTTSETRNLIEDAYRHDLNNEQKNSLNQLRISLGWA